ncbi:MAG: MFS transporter [Candidatus Rariloculaceae bacterium]
MYVSAFVAMKFRPGDARVIWSWGLYDFANSAFTTLVITFVYATYFTQAMAPDPITGTALWSRAIAFTAIVVAVFSPILGAIADCGGYRKLFVVLATLICAAATIALYFVLPGQLLMALGLLIVANIAYEFGTVFYNAFLPDLSTPESIGRVSGIAWGLGYLGGLFALGIALVTLIQPDTPWFGFSRDSGENIRATNLLVGGWFLVFSLPLLLWVPESGRRATPSRRVFGSACAQILISLKEIRNYRQIVRFLIARMFFNDGLITIFAFGGIYAAGTFGFTLQEVLLFGIALNVAAGLGAVLFGYVDDKIGSKRTLMITLAGLFLATLLAVLATSKLWFWMAGIVIGIFVGPNQAASRSLMARFVPHNAKNEFFGFFALSGKLTAFIGPLLLGILAQWSGSQRVGISVVLVLFAIGGVLLAIVDEDEGISAANS